MSNKIFLATVIIVYSSVLAYVFVSDALPRIPELLGFILLMLPFALNGLRLRRMKHQKS